MTTTPQTWHYGLVAQWWAEFNTEGPEIAYFQLCIARSGQPALDVACGTGRLLLPYLRAGLETVRPWRCSHVLAKLRSSYGDG